MTYTTSNGMNKNLLWVWIVFATAGLFSDGFESGNFNDWTASSSPWVVTSTTTQYTHGGTKRATAAGPGNGLLIKQQSTAGFENIQLSYWYRIQQAFEGGDHVFTEWSADGTAWNQIADHMGPASGSFGQVLWLLPSLVNDQGGFQFRFRASLGNSSDVFWLDDVELTGNLISTPTPTLTPAPTQTEISTPTPVPTETPAPAECQFGQIRQCWNVEIEGICGLGIQGCTENLRWETICHWAPDYYPETTWCFATPTPTPEPTPEPTPGPTITPTPSPIPEASVGPYPAYPPFPNTQIHNPNWMSGFHDYVRNFFQRLVDNARRVVI